MKKRGFLLAEQVVKIVIALISLSFLIYLLSSLYFSKIGLENQQKAQDFVLGQHDSLKTFISSNLSKGDIVFFNPNVPNGWYLFSFTGDERPTSCERKKCLCVCDNVVDIFSRQIEECNEKGACLVVETLKDYDTEVEIELRVKPLTNLSIQKINNVIEVSER